MFKVVQWYGFKEKQLVSYSKTKLNQNNKKEWGI